MREGWICEDLSNCIRLKSGDNLTAKEMVAGSFPVYGGNDIAGYHNQYNLQGDNIIIGRVGAQCGNARFIHEKIWLTDNAFKITDLKYDFDLQFLNYLLNFVGLRDYARQAAQPVISNSSLKNVKLSFPKSIEEQKQIVTILDEAFEAIEQAQANIEKNIENAKELFQSKLNEIFSQKGEGWEEKTLGEACIVERGSSPRPIKKYITESEDGVNWIKIGDVAENAKFVTHTKQKITKEGAEKSRYVGKGDFILSNSMSFGRPYIMKIDGYIHDGWFVLRLPEDIHSDYFWQLLSSSFVKNQINQLAAGAIVKNISGDLVKKVNLSIPPLEIQRTISSECNSLGLVIRSIISTYEKKLTNLEDLKKSLLEKAFAGELSDKDMPA